MRLVRKDIDKLSRYYAAQEGLVEKTVYGVIDMKCNVIRRWKGSIGFMEETDETPTILCCEAVEPMLTKHRRIKVLYGGRAGTKSIFAMDTMVGDVNANGTGVFCLREHMKSINQSIYRGMVARIATLQLKGFIPVASQWRIDHANKGIISFGGLQNVQDMKSLFNYKYFLLEESDNLSEYGLDTLSPTLRGQDNCEMWLLFNPKASNDPVSRNFIIPYQRDLERYGFYEDEFHLIVNVNYSSNPWFYKDSSIATELKKDQHKVKKKLMSKARYNHIWNGHFLDTVENGIINPDWIDAAVDAHIKLKFEGQGGFIAASDIADTGDDSNTFGYRQGSVVQSLEIVEAVNANRAFDDSAGRANRLRVSKFIWDASGMGALLRDQAELHFNETRIDTFMYKGAESPFNPKAPFKFSAIVTVGDELLNEDVFYNRRAQDYISLAERFRLTYDAVENGTYIDPAELISIPSGLECMQELRSQLGRLPLKPHSSSKVLLYSKEEGKRGIVQPDGTKIVIPSPDLADTLSMMFSEKYFISRLTAADCVMPTPIPVMGTAQEIKRGRY